MPSVKFSSKIDSSVLKALRAYASESKQNISDLLTDAVSAHLEALQIRPAFRRAAERVIEDNAELLERLAR